MGEVPALIDLGQARVAVLRANLQSLDETVLEMVLPREQEKDPTRHGGFFCVADLASGMPLLVVPIGKFRSQARMERFRFNGTEEKPGRLAITHREQGHISSWQTRDPEARPHPQYGGAIVIGPGLIFSFSGFTEHGDECVAYLAAVAAGYDDPPLVAKLGRISQNPYLLDQTIRLI